MARRLSRRDIIAAGGLVAAGVAGCIGSGDSADNDGNPDNGNEEAFENTLEWGGQGRDEHAELDCPDDTGYWKWVLAGGGGPTAVEEGAKLTVIFEDSTEVTADGYRPGEGGGAVHFDIFKEGGGTVDDAIVRFDGGGGNPILTISETFCEGDEPEIEVKTDPATDINASTAMLQGELTEMGDFERVTVYFEWRNVEDSEWMRTDDQPLNDPGPFSAEIEGLVADNRYEFRAIAEANGQRVVGGTLDFLKPEKEPPEIATKPATEVNESTAMLNGELTQMGDFEQVDVYFEWRQKETEEWLTTEARTLMEPGHFSVQVGDLEVTSEYEFRSVAESNDVRVVGEKKQFTKEEEPAEVYWQVDFGEGENAPVPPHYWPDDGFHALGTDQGVLENPSHARMQTDGQLGDVTIEDHSFAFDDEDEPEAVSITFTVEEGGEARYLHLAVFTLPGPYDPDEVEDQELYDEISAEYAGGDTDTLTLPLPQP